MLDGLHEDLNRFVWRPASTWYRVVLANSVVRHRVHVKPATIQEEANGRPDLEVAQRSWRLHLMRNQSVVVDLFQGQLKVQLLPTDRMSQKESLVALT